MIPKIIHYVWLGGNEKSKLIKKCIASWKKYCPDYEIKEWNESNFDINSVPYVKEACEAKKWAFASDYIRHYVLYNEGGVYLDTDVELLKTLDNLLNQNFIGQESEGKINSGLMMGCEKGDNFCKYMLSQYDNEKFVLEDGKLNLKTVCDRTLEYFSNLGYEPKEEKQFVANYTIYPTEYFCPKDYETRKLNITENSYSIHHYDSSWHTPSQKFKNFIIRKLGRKNVSKILSVIKGEKK